MSKRTPPFVEYPQWTTARFWSYIRSALRRAWTRWPPRYKALNKAAVKYRGKDKRRKYSYRCAHCKKLFKQNEVQVDHIIACGTLRDYQDLPGFVQRMFVSEDKLQVLCKSCHKKKEEA